MLKETLESIYISYKMDGEEIFQDEPGVVVLREKKNSTHLR